MSEYPTDTNFVFEVMRVISALDKAKDPSYAVSMKRLVPSAQHAHAVRVPAVRRIASTWLREHRDASLSDILNLSEALWATGWREERIVAVNLIGLDPGVVTSLDWDLLRRWSGDVDNWELIDHLSDVGGRLLQMKPRLLSRVEALAGSENPLQRRMALVTLIVAAKDPSWQGAVRALADRLKADSHPLVRKAVVWARRVLGQPKGATIGR